jgi:hypothetical protein
MASQIAGVVQHTHHFDNVFGSPPTAGNGGDGGRYPRLQRLDRGSIEGGTHEFRA